MRTLTPEMRQLIEERVGKVAQLTDAEIELNYKRGDPVPSITARRPSSRSASPGTWRAAPMYMGCHR